MINRGPFNALVDDDGSGTTGSVWNKAAIQNVLLDPIDGNPTFSDVPFNVANFWAGVTAGMVTANRVTFLGKVGFWEMNISGAPAPAGPYLYLIAPFSTTANNSTFSPCAYAQDATGITPAYIVPSGIAGQIAVVKNVGGNWSGSVFASFTIVVFLT